MTVPPDARLNGQFMAKEPGVVAGLEVVGLTFSMLDERVQFAPLVADGERVEAGCVIGTVSGPGQALLSGERVALNFLLLTISVAVSGLTSGDRLPSTVYMLWEKSRARGSTELTGWEVPPCWRGWYGATGRLNTFSVALLINSFTPRRISPPGMIPVWKSLT